MFGCSPIRNGLVTTTANARTDSGTNVRRTVGLAIELSAGWTLSFYAFLNFMPTFTRAQPHLSLSDALLADTIGTIAFTMCVFTLFYRCIGGRMGVGLPDRWLNWVVNCVASG